ncbi:hypothetical protein SNEBB_009261 [Seison nebaliae]|nr:hypothetical protein SNEBB_009261 [Seison nebaliae]
MVELYDKLSQYSLYSTRDDYCDNCTSHCLKENDENNLCYCHHDLIVNECPIQKDYHQNDIFYNQWSDWSQCSHDCGGGVTTRYRSVCLSQKEDKCLQPKIEICQTINYQNFNGIQLSDLLQSKKCNTIQCTTYSEWSEWSDCSTKNVCGEGEKRRTIECFGSKCHKSIWREKRSCSTISCDFTHLFLESTNKSHGGRVVAENLVESPKESFNGKRYICRTTEEIDNEISKFLCRKYFNSEKFLIGNGEKKKNEKIIKFTQFSSLNFYPLTNLHSDWNDDEFQCESILEVACSIDGEWSSWEEWSSCSVSCGEGTKKRSRKCENKINEGNDCPGDDIEVLPCSAKRCGYERSCSHIYDMKNGEMKSGEYYIDPNKTNEKFLVYCQTEDDDAKTIIKHNNEENVFINDFQTTTINYLTYNISQEQILQIIELSSQCRQHLQWKCMNSMIHSPEFYAANAKRLTFDEKYYVSWSNRVREKKGYFGRVPSNAESCECGLLGTCYNRTTLCNCDNKLDGWQMDEGYIVNKNDLPITSFNIIGRRMSKEQQEGYWTIGHLECNGIEEF